MPTITDINSSSFWEQKSSLFGLLNYSITTAEKRLAAITGGRDTISANSGYMVFDTLLNGTLVERMRVTSAGKVGIGTTNPAWTLDVTGDINASGALRLNGAALSTTGNFWAAGSGGAIYYNGGNVGIGTASPFSTLAVASDMNWASSQQMQLHLQGVSNQNRKLVLGYDTVNNYGVIQGFEATVGYKNLALNPNGGNVGIGTTNPQVLLDLPGYSPSNSAVRFGTMEFQTLTLNNGWWADNVFYNGSVYIYRNTGYGSVLTHANGNFYFST